MTQRRYNRAPQWLAAAVRACCVLFVIAGLCAVSGRAWSQQTPSNQDEGSAEASESGDLSEEERKKFQRLVEEAKVHYTKGDYAKALELFKEAYDIKSAPNLLFNIGLSAEKSGNLEEAVRYYEKFVVSPKVTLQLRDKAQKRIDVLEPIVEDQKSKEGDGNEKAEKPDESKQPDELAQTGEEEREEESSSEGRSRESSGQASSDGSSTSEFEPSPVPQDGTAADSSGSSPLGYVLAGVGVASIGGGVVFTLLSQNNKKTFRTAKSPAVRRDARDAAYRNQWIADGLFVGGLGSGVAATLILLNQGGSEGEKKGALVPTIEPNYAGLRYRTSF